MNVRKNRAAFVIFVWLALFVFRSDGFAREWRDPTGKFSIEAALIEVKDGNVRLRRENGSIVSVPIERLSEADRRYLTSLDKKRLTLVKDGKPMAVIVTNGRPREGQATAAVELQEHVRLMSGATLPIVAENKLTPESPKTLILLGPSNRTMAQGVNTKAFEPETFVIRTTDDALILAGEDGGSKSNPRTGTLWAVYDFLQDQLGIRWIWPGEIGRVVPKRSTIEVGTLDIRETPRIKVRGFRMVTQEKHRVGYEKEGLGQWLDLGAVYERVSEDERTWLRRMRMGRSFKLSYGHAFTEWWERYKDTSPEIFAMQSNGRHEPRRSDRPDFVKMCVSNPKLWDLQLAKIRKYAAEGARGQWLNACENDGSGGFCECSRCRAWDAESGDDANQLPDSLSDRYARWYNELAVRTRQIDPDSRVIAYAYSRYRSPPTKLDSIEPNVWIGYVGFNGYPRSESARKMSVDEWFGWSRLGATVFLRSNSLFYCGEGAPYVVTRQLAKDTQFQIANGLRATDYDCLQGYWATTGPSYYVLARMLWDTDAEPDRLLDEFYGSFGPMRDVVRDYFDYWESFTTKLGNHRSFSELRRPDRMRAYPKYYTRAVFARSESILERAKPLLPTASESQRERFHNLELGLQHGRLLTESLRDGQTSTGTSGERLLRFRRQIAARNVVNVYWTTSKEKRYRVF